ncbi:glycoside hydrolase family 13 [Sinosporangium siamense]|uniref:Isoamylase n=1 Tax=Sinosporangium siamense TaxID=1367973 RepID=A0A919RIN8_9ACTN|nr:glycoside hydrolase family 13 [Sinosporangium siamense]GII94507.1 hypothetical protein Ssi02_47380 [Sinosporangium siamense]
MITQSEPDEHGLVTVVFTLPAGTSGHVSVVGDFNNWDPHTDPMGPGPGDRPTAVVQIPYGSTVVFRYLAEGGLWFDDPEADSHDERGGVLLVGAAPQAGPVW